MSRPWTAFYFGDYLADTSHLSLAEHGAYLLLMGHYYRTGRPLPANAEVLHRICRCESDAERTAVQKVLDEFFVDDGKHYRHGRIEAELGKAADISTKRKNAANKRHHGEHASADANASDLQPVCTTQSQSQPQSPEAKARPVQTSKDFSFSSSENFSASPYRRTLSQAERDSWDLRRFQEQMDKTAPQPGRYDPNPDRSWRKRAKDAAYCAGLSPDRCVALLKQHWPKDPNVDLIFVDEVSEVAG